MSAAATPSSRGEPVSTPDRPAAVPLPLARADLEPRRRVATEVGGGLPGDRVARAHRGDDAELAVAGVRREHVAGVEVREPGDDSTSSCGPPGSSDLRGQADALGGGVRGPPQLGDLVGSQVGHGGAEVGLGGDGRHGRACSGGPSIPEAGARVAPELQRVGQRDAVLAAAILGRREDALGHEAVAVGDDRRRCAAGTPRAAPRPRRPARRTPRRRPRSSGRRRRGSSTRPRARPRGRSPAAARRPARPGRGRPGRAVATGRRRPPAAGSASPAAAAAARR